MLDFFSRKRMRDERNEIAQAPPRIGEIMPNFAFNRPDGLLVFLSAVRGPFVLLALTHGADATQTYLVQSFADKIREVRPEITRALVVTGSEHLSTVVALAGDMLILSDFTGEAVLQLAPEEPMLYFVDERRQVTKIVSANHAFPGLIPRSLRPAA